MSILFNDNFLTNAPKPTDSRYMKFSGGNALPYDDVADANTRIPSTQRYRYLTILVLMNTIAVEYWYKNGIADGDLITKSKEVYVMGASGNFTMKAGEQYSDITVLPPSDLANFRMGTGPSTFDLVPGQPVTSAKGGVFGPMGYAVADTVIYLTGMVTNTQVIVRKMI